MTRSPDNSLADRDSYQELKKKSIVGMRALFVRQVLVKGIFFAGNVILARLLAPQVFGLYAIVGFVVQFFSTFGDVGIGAALIQKKGELSEEELSSTFWLQQMLVWLVVGGVFVAAPLALKLYPELPQTSVWLIRAMAVSFLFSSLKTIPAILMERDIDFKRIAWVDITENMVFQLVAISCAFLGFEIWSFILAAITRSLLGAVIIYSVSPWRPAFEFRFESVRGLARFGLPYQGNQILSFIKDAVTPLFVGAYAGAAAVGYVNWARNLAFAPLIISESFGRVAFPAFSRLQTDKELLTRAVERSIRMMTLVLFPITAIMFALGPEITRLVFTDKWMPGINTFYFFCMTPLCIGISLPLYSAILSLGKSRILLIMTVALIVFEWGLGIPFVIYCGFVGIAMTQPVVVLLFTCVYLVVLNSNNIKIKVLENIVVQLAASVTAGLSVKLAAHYIDVGFFYMFVISLVGLLIYGVCIYFFKTLLFIEFKDYLVRLSK